MMKRILVIGSKGFIGSHLMDFYATHADIELHSADVVVDYRAINYYQVSAENSDYKSIFQKNDYDLCVNCSGAASVPDSLENPERDFLLNTNNVQRILEAIRLFSPNCRFLNLSSAAVYGNPAELPIKENQSLRPVSPYGVHKLFAEQLCEEYYRFFGISTCSLRIFSAYGEGLYKQLFYDLFRKERSGGNVLLYGSGEESRDFIHVKDIVRVIDLVAKKGMFNGSSLNVANGVEVAIKDAVTIFFNKFNKRISFSFSGEGREGDPSNWVADISEIKGLGYVPEIELSTGLKRYYEWVIQSE